MSSSKQLNPGIPRPGPTAAYWQWPPNELAAHQSASLPSRASVVIIGSGITAASVAHHLYRRSPGISVVVLEARTITSGATGRNGGHCKDVPYKTYKQWKLQFGKEIAQRLVRFTGNHLSCIRDLSRALHDQGVNDAQFREVESITAAFDDSIFRDLKSGLQTWLEDFPKQRESCSVTEGDNAVQQDYGIIGAVGALSTRAAALQPYRLVTGLFETMLRDHPTFALEAFTTVTSIRASENDLHPFLVDTNRGTIEAQHVVHCNNGFVSHLLPGLCGKVVPVRGQMTALRPSREFPRLGHSRSWSLCYSNGGFDYMTQEENEEGLVLLGGGVEQAALKGVVDLNCGDDAAQNGPALEHLCSVLPQYFKGGKGTTLKQSWTGIMGFTPDGLPIVGQVSQEVSQRHVGNGARGKEWVAAGFGGYGMVLCWHSGRAIADMICGVPLGEIDEYFPREQFECSPRRLSNMSFESLETAFHKNAPVIVRPRL